MPETDLREELEAAIERDEPFGPADESTPLREVQAATLREAIIAPLNHPDGAKRLRLQRVLIVGELDLESQQISLRLQMKDCELKDAFSIRQARAIDITLFDCVIGGPLFANQLYLRWNFRLNGSSLHNGATLLGAKIGGQLSVNSTKLKALKSGDGKVAGPAFNADRVEVSGGMFCDGMESEGEVRLLGAKVGELSVERAKLKSLKDEEGKGMRPALNADRVRVSGSMFCRGMETEGEVRLLGAKVGGQLSMREASLTATADDKCGLKLIGAEVDELILAFKEVDGVVDVTDAKVRSLWDAEYGEFSGQHPPALRLQGFRYESLREPLSAEQRLEWIDRSQQGQHQPGVYAELAEAYRRIGHRADARAIGIASERRGREDGTLVKKIWSWLLWKSVRYGYENWRAAAGLVIVITIGSILFWVAECRFVETVREPPGLSPFIYATDVAIPVLDVGQTRTWAADGWLEWVELVLAISGYAFVAAVIAGLAGIFNRDQV